MYHGDHELEQESQIYDWFQGGGCELITRSFTEEPSYIELVAEQFERFNVPLTQTLGEELIRFSGNVVEHVLGCMEPYAMFWNTTDVVLTDEWREYCFQMNQTPHLHDGGSFEIDPEKLETFRHCEGLDQVFFDNHIIKPGLQALPYCLGDTIESALWDEYIYLSMQEMISGEAMLELEDLCLVNANEVDRTRMKAYFELGCWSASLWALGPMGRDWRYASHEIFAACYSEGACIIYDGLIYDRSSYIQLERPPRSCYICGVSAWCVEFTLDGDVTRQICESCLNSGLGLGSERGCGTKYCHHVACPNHPAHTTERGGYWMSVRGRGQLSGLAGGTSMDQLAANRMSPKLLTSK